MHLLADENIPTAVVDHLRKAGFDVEYIVETAPGLFDPSVLKLARKEARLLITADRDFGTLIFAEHTHVPIGVLYLRMGTARPQTLVDAVLGVLTDPERELLGYFTTLQPGRVRQRPLPP